MVPCMAQGSASGFPSFPLPAAALLPASTPTQPEGLLSGGLSTLQQLFSQLPQLPQAIISALNQTTSGGAGEVQQLLSRAGLSNVQQALSTAGTTASGAAGQLAAQAGSIPADVEEAAQNAGAQLGAAGSQFGSTLQGAVAGAQGNVGALLSSVLAALPPQAAQLEGAAGAALQQGPGALLQQGAGAQQATRGATG